MDKFRRVVGYEPFDGQLTQHMVPGSGPILACYLFDRKVFAFRRGDSDPVLWVATAAGWKRMDKIMDKMSDMKMTKADMSMDEDEANENETAWTKAKSDRKARY